MTGHDAAMQVRWTVVDPSARPPVHRDVDVTAPSGTLFAAVSDALADVLGRAPGGWYAGSVAVQPTTALGYEPLLHGAVLAAGTPTPDPGRGAVLALRVAAGPAAGRTFPLTAGTYVVGRSGGADLGFDDPDLSRRHACVTVTPEAVTVRDLGSANGTLLAGVPVGRDDVPLPLEVPLQVGGSHLVLGTTTGGRAATRTAGDGRIEVNRAPRLLPPAGDVVLDRPAGPRLKDAPRLPVLPLALPLVLGAVLAVTLQPLYGLFMLLSPVLVLGNTGSEWWTTRTANRRALREHAVLTNAFAAARQAAVDVDLRRRRDRCPDPAEVLAWACEPGTRVWERNRDDEDALRVRLGEGPVASSVVVQEVARIQERVLHASAPVTVDLRSVGVLGVAGGGPAGALAAALLGQLAVLHSPRDLTLVVLAGDGAGHSWDWVRWLPHAAPRDGQPGGLFDSEDGRAGAVAGLVALLDAESAAPGRGARSGPFVVVVLDDAQELRGRPGIARLLEEGPGRGICVIAVADAPRALPAECRATAELVGPAGSRLLVEVGGSAPVAGAVADLVDRRWARRLARALAPLTDATPSATTSALPARARLLDHLPFDATDPDELQRSWRRPTPGVRCVLGVAADGDVVLDLSTDGPHVLVAGTTGAGKSELLQTLVASLATQHPPDAVCLVLVDYKGGSAFRDCAQLPHTLGLVTDLDPTLATRALVSLRAEVRRRERVLRDHAAADLSALLRTFTGAGPPPLARLVIVVDEFATLAEELPDFVGGLVGIAQRGRSLGMHLVLATQRPAGVVSPEIRANTEVRIALRVADPADSTDVIDSRAAAWIDRGTPGRGLLRTGSGPVGSFQTARVTGTGDPAEIDRIQVRPTGGAPPAPQPAREPDSDDVSDLQRIVLAARSATSSLGLVLPPSPWLAPLPAVVSSDDIAGMEEGATVIGLSDRPSEQARRPVVLDLAEQQHLLLAGGTGSGRTTALRTIATLLAERFPPADVHIHGIDAATGGLGVLAALPHAGTVVAPDDTDRGTRLLTRLQTEVAHRRKVLSTRRMTSLTEHRGSADPSERFPWVLLLLDSWEGFVSRYEGIEHGRPVEVALGLLREGAAMGVLVLVTGDRSSLTSRMATSVPRRLLLRFADRNDVALAGVPPRVVPAAMPPGRCIDPSDLSEVQLAVLGPDPTAAAQLARVLAVAESPQGRAGPLRADDADTRHLTPLRIRSLPTRVGVGEVARDRSEPPGRRALLGVGGDDLGTVEVDFEGDGRAFLVAGPPGSGQSTALATMAGDLLGRGQRVLVVADRSSPLHHLAGHPCVLGPYRPAEAPGVAEALRELGEQGVVLCDDIETIVDGPVEAALSSALRAGTAVAVSGRTDDLAGAYRGLAAEVRRARHGLLLSPGGALDGDLLGTRVSRLTAAPPGRGVLVRAGRTRVVQVAEDDGHDAVGGTRS